jgi:Nif-specific regulatory protein
MLSNIQIPNTPECQSCSLTFSYKELELLYEITLLMNESLDIHYAITQGMTLLKRRSYLERCAIFMADDERSKVTLFNGLDITSIQERMAIYKPGEGATGLAFESKEPIVIEDIHKSIDYLNKLGTIPKESISYIAVPIIFNGDAVGVISANITQTTPYDLDEIVRILTITGSIFSRSILNHLYHQRQKENIQELETYYKNEVLETDKFDKMIGNSTKMQQVFSIINTIAPTDATALIRGETGTGKELIATAIHNFSQRKERPFIKLNCAAISDTLLESELFGHEKGAFTDAKEMRKGRFELADTGTLFLDEIGDISPNLQVKLLRIIQEQEFERVGGNKTIKVNVRLVTATNRDLEQMVKDGEFREDLYYRLNVIPINLPPLRERYEDIPLLVHHFIDKYAKVHKKNISIAKETMELLLQYPWPGNIRELQNTAERIVLICHAGTLTPDMLNHVLPYNFQKLYQSPSLSTDKPNPIEHTEPIKTTLLTKEELEKIERKSIIEALNENNGIQAKAARQLGMTARQIGYKIRKYQITI